MAQAKRPTAREQIMQDLQRVLKDAEAFGLVVTVSQKPLLPLAMRNYTTVVEVRERIVR